MDVCPVDQTFDKAYIGLTKSSEPFLLKEWRKKKVISIYKYFSVFCFLPAGEV